MKGIVKRGVNVQILKIGQFEIRARALILRLNNIEKKKVALLKRLRSTKKVNSTDLEELRSLLVREEIPLLNMILSQLDFVDEHKRALTRLSIRQRQDRFFWSIINKTGALKEAVGVFLKRALDSLHNVEGILKIIEKRKDVLYKEHPGWDDEIKNKIEELRRTLGKDIKLEEKLEKEDVYKMIDEYLKIAKGSRDKRISGIVALALRGSHLGKIAACLLIALTSFFTIEKAYSAGLGQSVYTVQEDDKSAWGIARKLGIPFEQIEAANPEKDLSLIHVGDQIIIPVVNVPQSVESNKQPGVYIVEPDDTAYGIARKFGVTYPQLVAANGGNDLSLIHVGDRINIPVVKDSDAEQIKKTEIVKQEKQLLEPRAYYGPDRVNLTSGRHVGGSNSPTKIIVHITDSEGNSAENWFHNPNPPAGQAVSAHYIVYKNGEVVQIVEENKVAYHCKGQNDGSIGIECEGILVDDNQTTLTEAQLNKLVSLICYLQKKYNISDSEVYGHREFSSKACPGLANLNLVKSEISKYKP